MNGFVADGDIEAETSLADMIAEIDVELLGDVACQFQVLLLVVTDRNVGCPIHQNVCCHQARIGQQSKRNLLGILAGLVLELGHALHPTDARDAS